MKVLTGDQLNTAETVLKAFFPQSLQVYGHIFLLNRVNSDPVDVLVNSWPDFTIVVCRPQNKEEGDGVKTIYIFSKDEAALRKMLGKKDFLPWQELFFIGVDQSFELAVMSAAAAHIGVSAEKYAVARQMRLHDLSHLPALDSAPPFRLSSLDESHLDLVKGTWKFSEGRDTSRKIRNMMCNLPSCCLLDEDGMPVAWILTYPTGAMGLLYTVPEHRGKGCAKILISTLAGRLHALGCPVFCLIEEENHASYQLFTKMGFTEDPYYRGVDQCFELAMRSAAVAHGYVPAENICVARQMRLHDLSQLPVLDSNPPFRLSSLNESHLDLVMGTWKFSEGRDTSRMIRNMICNFPSCCLLDEDGMPVAWILTHPTGAMGLLYTVPEHRGKGCTKILISTLAGRLHALGCPVFCLIEEENHVSYQLFTKMGFTEDPYYRGVWYDFNC